MYRMVNTLEFTKRLEKILEEYDLSAASFAQKIEVGRATISHILSGRNKPSLDFVMKVTTSFPEVDLYWLLNGKGSFPKTQSATLPRPQTIVQKNSTAQNNDAIATFKSKDLLPKKSIDKIVIFYSDGSFESYVN